MVACETARVAPLAFVRIECKVPTWTAPIQVTARLRSGPTGSSSGSSAPPASWFGPVLAPYCRYLPLFLKEQAHASEYLIGVIAAAYYLGALMFSAPLGRLSDTMGRKPVIVSGVALYAVATLLFLSTTHPGWFILFRFLEGTGAAAVGPAGQALVADLSTEQTRSRAYGWLTTAQFGGLVAGPGLAVPLYQLWEADRGLGFLRGVPVR